MSDVYDDSRINKPILFAVLLGVFLMGIWALVGRPAIPSEVASQHASNNRAYENAVIEK